MLKYHRCKEIEGELKDLIRGYDMSLIKVMRKEAGVDKRTAKKQWKKHINILMDWRRLNNG